MGVQRTVQARYQEIVNKAAGTVDGLKTQPEGWIATVRKALRMSGAQLARRLGVSRATVSQAEKHEVNGTMTFKNMHRIAEAMECRFVYAIVPSGDVNEIIRAQAERKARSLVGRASVHMALENQALSNELNEVMVAEMTEDWIRDMPYDFWEDR